MFVIIIKVFIL